MVLIELICRIAGDRTVFKVEVMQIHDCEGCRHVDENNYKILSYPASCLFLDNYSEITKYGEVYTSEKVSECKCSKQKI